MSLNSLAFIKQNWKLCCQFYNERYTLWHFKKRLIWQFINLNNILPGNLYQYPPCLPRKEKFPKNSLPKNPLSICIVTPSFNQGAYIRATIESVLQDRLSQLDYLVIDGASQDQTCKVLEDLHREKRVFRWQSLPDQGQADAINRGFSQVQGEIMGWVNSDDVLMPGALRFVTDFFAAHPEIDVVYGHRLLINQEGQEIGRWIVPPYYSGCLKYFDYVPQETLFWRRHIWEKAGGYLNDKYYFALDWELLQRFERVGAKFIRLPYFLACFRVHPEQKTTARIDIGKKEMDSLRPHLTDKTAMRKAVQKELLYARLSHCFLSCGIRSTRF